MEEDIKVLEKYIKEQEEFKKQFNLEEIEDGTEGQKRLQAIENLIKGYRELEEKINKLEILKTKLLKEFECANEGFMKKQIPTSVVDGIIAQEVSWILQEIDDILQEGDK
jgi:predicted RNase H-like nuclease (RuvC/YqgF family)